MRQIGKATTLLPLRYRPWRRLPQLYGGLALYGLSMALMVRAHLGSMPWDVFHQGVAKLTGLTFGLLSIVVGAVVLLLWIPLRQRPGLGTVSNVFVVGLAADGAFSVLPQPDLLTARIGYLAAGILLNAIATSLYIGARFGPGPRDGLMTGIAARGYSLRLVRTGIEVVVVATGWLLGGTLGAGTVVYAVVIGPLVQAILPKVRVSPPAVAGEPAAHAAVLVDAGSSAPATPRGPATSHLSATSHPSATVPRSATSPESAVPRAHATPTDNPVLSHVVSD